MRHRKSGRKLKRTASHRRATLAALSTALLRHKRITTTVAKAKETRMVVEKLITRAKNAVAKTDAPATGVHARREVGRLIKDRKTRPEVRRRCGDGGDRTRGFQCRTGRGRKEAGRPEGEEAAAPHAFKEEGRRKPPARSPC